LDIIAFLLKNWYLIIVVYAIISGIRGTRKRAAGGRSAPKGSMPPFGGDGGPTIKPKKVPSKADTRAAASGGAITAGRPDRIELSRSAAAGDTAANVRGQAPARLSSRRSIKAEPDRPSSEVGQWSENPIVNGVIWSEILSAPRSKRPYSK
jgi:hypothetical protein